MKRRINYTGRKKIPKKRITIALNKGEEKDLIKSFDTEINLKRLDLPKDAKVIVEAYHLATTPKSYNFGTVDKIETPEDTSLGPPRYSESLSFRVLVVEEDGKILASAENIEPLLGTTEDSGREKRKAMLPLEITDLGDQLWCLSYERRNGAPLLKINKKLPKPKKTAEDGPRFILAAYPSLLRQILMRMTFIQPIKDSRDPPFSWQKDWLDFCEGLHNAPPENMNPNKSQAKKEEIRDWIDGVVKNFCRKWARWGEIRRVLR